MSRPPGGYGMQDVRATEILQDYLFDTDPCTPGATESGRHPKPRRSSGRKSKANEEDEEESRKSMREIRQSIRKSLRQNGGHFEELDEETTQQSSSLSPELHPGDKHEPGEPPEGFDKPKYLVMCVMAMLIVAIIIGYLNCIGIYISVIQNVYGIGFIEICFTMGLTYAVLIKTSCLAVVLIRWVGHRQTALFGMLIFFIGVMIDAFTFHFSVFYIANIVFIGIGGGLAYASAMSLAGDLFRKNLAVAMLIVSIGGSIGTIALYWFSFFLLKHVSYRWTRLSLALIVLIFAAATHIFPDFIIDDGLVTQDDSQMFKKSHLYRNQEIKESVQEAAKRDKIRRHAPKSEDARSYLCVCVCDIALWSDFSFILWGVCVMIATMAIYAPYLFILAYAETIPALLSPWYITILCIASIVGRVIVVIGTDFTFAYNRILFMVGVIGSGVLWIVIPFIETYGWIIVWCAIMGVIEGLIVCTIPRLTILTLPRHWVDQSWGIILWFQAIGVFIICVFVAIISRELVDFFVVFTGIGIIQLIGGFLSLLLPNEEDRVVFEDPVDVEAPLHPPVHFSKRHSVVSTRRMSTRRSTRRSKRFSMRSTGGHGLSQFSSNHQRSAFQPSNGGLSNSRSKHRGGGQSQNPLGQGQGAKSQRQIGGNAQGTVDQSSLPSTFDAPPASSAKANNAPLSPHPPSVSVTGITKNPPLPPPPPKAASATGMSKTPAPDKNQPANNKTIEANDSGTVKRTTYEIKKTKKTSN